MDRGVDDACEVLEAGGIHTGSVPEVEHAAIDVISVPHPANRERSSLRGLRPDRDGTPVLVVFWLRRETMCDASGYAQRRPRCDAGVENVIH